MSKEVHLLMVECDEGDTELMERFTRSSHQFADHTFCSYALKDTDIASMESYIRAFIYRLYHNESPSGNAMKPRDIMLLRMAMEADDIQGKRSFIFGINFDHNTQELDYYRNELIPDKALLTAIAKVFEKLMKNYDDSISIEQYEMFYAKDMEDEL